MKIPKHSFHYHECSTERLVPGERESANMNAKLTMYIIEHRICIQRSGTSWYQSTGLGLSSTLDIKCCAYHWCVLATDKRIWRSVKCLSKSSVFGKRLGTSLQLWWHLMVVTTVNNWNEMNAILMLIGRSRRDVDLDHNATIFHPSRSNENRERKKERGTERQRQIEEEERLLQGVRIKTSNYKCVKQI